jgi:TM2 domain-containing membrane protein YozV
MTSSSKLAYYQTRIRDRKTTSYLLWLLCLFGFAGFHRLYNGKIASGLLWLFTWGFFGFGQFVDLFLIPDMSDHQSRKLYGDLLTPDSTTPALVDPPITKDPLPIQLLKLAQQNGGKLTVTQSVIATGESFKTIEEQLKAMVKAGYADITNAPDSGIIVYEFQELLVPKP